MWAGFLIAAALLIAAPLHAAPAHRNRQRVVKLVKKSATLYEAGSFREAIKLLHEAYAIEPDPTVLYNLARAYEGQGNLNAALDAYQRYTQSAPKARDRGAVEQRIATLQRQIEENAALKRERDAAAARAKQARGAAERAERKQQRPARSERHASSVPWIVAGLGAAVTLGGVYFGLRARARHDQARDAKLARDAADLNGGAHTFALLANVSFVAGGALVVGGVSWGVLTWPSTSRSSVTARLLPAPGFTLRGTF